MDNSERFIQHYKDGFMPWAHEKADFNLVEMVDNWPIKPCKTLELGCGTGTDALWLAKQGFEVTAYDISPIAIEMANKNAEENKVQVNFKIYNFLSEKLKSKQYGFVFDRGVLHGFETLEDRQVMVRKVSETLEDNGLWLSLIGNADGEKTDPGPPLRTATEVVSAVEPFFRILAIRTSYLDDNLVKPAKAWVCLMRKR